jgi:DNA-binding HxlR family transcriptional regulator
MAGDPEPVTHLLSVISSRHAVEVLDLLAESPRTFDELRRCLHARRKELDRTLRALAADGAVRRWRPGTWDHDSTCGDPYELTAAGHHLADQLSDIEVWTAIYETYLHTLRQGQSGWWTA